MYLIFKNEKDLSLQELTMKRFDYKTIKLTWEKISVAVPSKSINLVDRFRKKVPNEDKKIVIDGKKKFPRLLYALYSLIWFKVDGIAHSSEVLAIMGGSGAGKTSFINALNFRNRGSLKVIEKSNIIKVVRIILYIIQFMKDNRKSKNQWSTNK